MTTSPSEPTEDQDKSEPQSAETEETAPEYIDDSQLPDDLQPRDDNPLAQNEDE